MEKKNSGKFYIVIIIVIALILIIGGGITLSKKRAQLAKVAKFNIGKTPVSTFKTINGVLKENHKYMAVVEPLQTANISSRVTAIIEKIHHLEGENVKKGELLISLDDRQYRDGLASMNAQIEQTKSELAVNMENIKTLRESLKYWEKELKRNQNLIKSGSIPISKVDATTEKLNQVSGKLRSAEQMSTSIKRKIDSLTRKEDELKTTLSYCSIVSPFDGVVTIKRVDKGDLASPGKTLLVVEDRSHLKLSFDVPQYDLPNLRKGMVVRYISNNVEKKSKISRLYPSLNRARMARVEALIDSSNITLGAFVDVSVILNKVENATIIPMDSIIEMGENVPKKVFIVKDGKLVAKEIKIMATADKMAAVTGIKVGDSVVKTSFLGWARLHDGMNVEVF